MSQFHSYENDARCSFLCRVSLHECCSWIWVAFTAVHMSLQNLDAKLSFRKYNQSKYGRIKTTTSVLLSVVSCFPFLCDNWNYKEAVKWGTKAKKEFFLRKSNFCGNICILSPTSSVQSIFSLVPRNNFATRKFWHMLNLSDTEILHVDDLPLRSVKQTQLMCVSKDSERCGNIHALMPF